MTEEVQAALKELETEYQVTAEADGQGGAYVTVEAVDLGPRWNPTNTQVEFLIAYNYPYAAIYPYYTRPDLQRVDGGVWPSALQRVSWRGRDVIQVSLRCNRWQPAYDTASNSLRMVIHWFHTCQ